MGHTHAVYDALQGGEDALDRKRAVHLLRAIAAAAASRPPLATLLQLYESLDDFALYSVEVGCAVFASSPGCFS